MVQFGIFFTYLLEHEHISLWRNIFLKISYQVDLVALTNINLTYEIRDGMERIKIFQENVGYTTILKRHTDEDDSREIIIKRYDQINQNEIINDIGYYVKRGFEFETFTST